MRSVNGVALALLFLFSGVEWRSEAGQQRKPALAGNTTSRLPTLKPEQVKDAYYRAVVQELQVFRPRRLLLEADSTETYRRFSFDNREGRAIKEDIPVFGQLFTRAWEIRTEKKPDEKMTRLQRFDTWPIRRGDVLVIMACVNAEEPPLGKSAGVGRLVATIERTGEPNASVTLKNEAFSLPEEWTRVAFLMTAPRDFTAKDQLNLLFAFGGETQTIQIGGIAMMQFGAEVKIGELNRKLKTLHAPPGAKKDS
jgi:hypothetical protein